MTLPASARRSSRNRKESAAAPRLTAGPRRGRGRVTSSSLHVTGFALVVSGLGMALSALVDLLTVPDDLGPLTVGALVSGGVGAVLWWFTRPRVRSTPATAFVTVTLAWAVLGVAGAIPFWVAGTFAHWDDAIFETVSGFTATGATVLSPIEGTGQGLLFWRSLTQWLGGIGVVVLALSVLPHFGVGGLSLLAAEAPGPEAERLAPRVQSTAKLLLRVYVLITGLVIAGLLGGGLSIYDAATHAFTAVSTGGFSPYDASIAHFDSLWVEGVLIAGMLAGAINFALHWRVFTGRGPSVYWRSSEARAFGLLVIASTAFVTILVAGDLGWAEGLRESAFQVVSVVTTTGFATADFTRWAAAAQLVLVALMISGSMTGSTSGALKVMRVQVVSRVALRHVRRALAPRGVFVIRHDGRAVDEEVVGRVVALVQAYIVMVVAGMLAVTMLGSPIDEALGAVATSIGGVGPGLGRAGPAGNFLVFTRPARAVLVVLMIVGRLEVFPVLLTAAVAWRGVRDGTRHRVRHVVDRLRLLR
ncbi:MAG: TrkH family potassium uptake protein [Actinomyces sp.]|nr:MAG: TrkH family potassium uptake protein [Actinomyces sp.]